MINFQDGNPDKWKDFGGNCPLIKLFEPIHPISDDMKNIINRETYFVNIKKYKYLISPIDRNLNLFFIIKGVVRGYVKDGNKEITTWINAENEIVGTIKNLFSMGESDEYVQALEEIDAIVIPHTMTEYLFANFKEANFIGRIIMEKQYQGAEERAYLCRVTSAEKRYARYLLSSAEMMERISLKYIASYLGMRLETLCRIRSTSAVKHDNTLKSNIIA